MSNCKTINCPTCGFEVDETFVEQRCPRCQTTIESKHLCGSCHTCAETIYEPSQHTTKNNILSKILSVFSKK